MSSEIFVCGDCYDAKLMGRWCEYTGAAFSWRNCMFCGKSAKHWFSSPREIIRGLVWQLRAVTHERDLLADVGGKAIREVIATAQGKCADCTPERKCPDHGSCLVEDVGQD